MGIFNKTSRISIPQSVHDLSHTQTGSFKPGYIYPVFCDKVLPGDKWRITSVPFIRSQPFVSPLLTNVRVSFRYFYCRNQLLWKNFDEYITNKARNGSGEPIYHQPPVVGYHPTQGSPAGDFFDWMYDANDPDITYNWLDALPARMYNRIFAEYYANENTMPDIELRDIDGYDDASYYYLRQACYKKDYFTSALPWPQRGESVSLPTRVILDPDRQSNQILKGRGGNVTPGPLSAYNTGDVTHDPPYIGTGVPGSPDFAYDIDPNGTLTTQIDIRDLRRAGAVQRFLERSAVNGNRYAEYVLSNYGVHIPDRSSYRPQYLGGGEQLINFSPVEQNSETSGTPQGTLAGKGVLSGVVGMNHQYLFTEHGWIMCLMVIRPDATYVGGVHRHKFVTGDRLEDYANPLFQNIGMQAIRMHEIQFQNANHGYPEELSANMADFAYQERYADYKWLPDRCHGDLIKDTMRSWVAVRDMRLSTIGQAPVFNNQFVQVRDNVFDNNSAVSGKIAPFLGSIRHSIVVHRPLQYKAKYGGNV